MVDKWLVETELSEEFDFYTRANIGEVFPDPVMPLTFSLFETDGSPGPVQLGMREAFIRMGATDAEEVPADRNIFLGVTGGYAYLNASLWRLVGHRGPGMTYADIDAAFFGDAPGVPDFVPPTGPDRTDLEAKIFETMLWAFTATELPDVAADEQLVNRLRADRPDLTMLSDRELVEHGWGLMQEHFERLFGQHIYIGLVGTIPVGVIMQACTQLGRPGDALKLMAGLGDVESATPSFEMWELSRVVRESAALSELFDQGVDGLWARLRSGRFGSEVVVFGEALDDFLVRHGSRGPNEWEVTSPTWETDPELALAMIDRIRLSDDEFSPVIGHTAKVDERVALASEIGDMLAADPDSQGQFLGAVNSAGVFLAGRERTKTNCVKLIEEWRVAMREYGRRQVEAGNFAEVTDFGLLTAEELGVELDSPGTHRDVLADRAALRDEVAAIQEPFLFFGGRPDMSAYPLRTTAADATLAADDILRGVPGCPGVHRGTARVILSPRDAGDLMPGDVLVAPITDPSWTPLFVPAAAVVVDVGAPMSHAVIVSRELGIPCVVSATDATSLIPDGAEIEVDGTAGIVTVISAP
jgi:pyruvate,water dikinase